MMKNSNLPPTAALAASITKAASKQTYYTIRFMVDRQRVSDAYCAYAYFRWLDDTLDAAESSPSGCIELVNRQKLLLESCYEGQAQTGTTPEEQMLVSLVLNNPDKDCSLQAYLSNMMALMAFDADRRGRLISQAELETYTHHLASAVTEAMHYFIGHGCYSPQDETRYQAVTAAHITHMLRDMYDDIQAGYFNIPRELLETRRITLADMHSEAFRAWVRSRVQQARAYFKAGRIYLSQVENLRCKLAGFAYTSRFEWLLDTIEREGYCLRPQYNERKSLGTGLHMSWVILSAMLHETGFKSVSLAASSRPQSQRPQSQREI